MRTKSAYTTDEMASFFLNDSLHRQWQFINLMSSFDKLGTLVEVDHKLCYTTHSEEGLYDFIL